MDPSYIIKVCVDKRNPNLAVRYEFLLSFYLLHIGLNFTIKVPERFRECSLNNFKC